LLDSGKEAQEMYIAGTSVLENEINGAKNIEE
jgi:hypothetical protein